MSISSSTNITKGVRKAAILLMSLEEDDAAQILSRLPRRYVETVSIAIAQLETVSGWEQETIIQEFLDSRPSAIGPNSGGLDRAKNLVKKALGKDAGDTLSVLQQTMEALPFGFLHKADPQNILSFLIDEHPQTIAMVLSNIPPAVAAGVLSGLQPLRQLAVIQRIAEMGQTSPDAIEEVEKALTTRMALFMTQSYQKGGGVPSVAEMLNVSDRSTERAILDGLAKDKPELVEEIRRLMFVFEDVIKLNDKDIQTLLKNVETNQWAMALKGASQPLREKILGNMSQRAADMLREEMDFLGKVRLSEVESTQQKIVDVVRSQEDAGQLSRPTGDEEEEFVA
jgi:flagellar motor switch protein FliG